MNFNIHKYLRKLKITADERMHVPQKCTNDVRVAGYGPYLPVSANIPHYTLSADVLELDP